MNDLNIKYAIPTTGLTVLDDFNAILSHARKILESVLVKRAEELKIEKLRVKTLSYTILSQRRFVLTSIAPEILKLSPSLIVQLSPSLKCRSNRTIY